jgi:sulfur carrier protein
MRIIVNGKEKIVKNNASLSDIIKELRSTPKRVIAEVNGKIVKSENWNSANIKDNDVLELVTFVGGG